MQRRLSGVGGLAAEIGEGNHAHHSIVPVKNGQPPDLMIGHDLGSLFDGVVRETIKDVVGHNLPGGGIPGRPLVGNGANNDIAIGDHADQPIVLTYRRTVSLW